MSLVADFRFEVARAGCVAALCFCIYSSSVLTPMPYRIRILHDQQVARVEFYAPAMAIRPDGGWGTNLILVQARLSLFSCLVVVHIALIKVCV